MPKEAPPPGVDPWELAKEAIKLIREARERLSPTLRADYVDPAIELIRQLAWGPHPVTRPPRLKQAGSPRNPRRPEVDHQDHLGPKVAQPPTPQ